MTPRMNLLLMTFVVMTVPLLLAQPNVRCETNDNGDIICKKANGQTLHNPDRSDNGTTDLRQEGPLMTALRGPWHR
uniref:Conopeptide n=1 Tax=Conus lenavati TaxID=1519839 RepID=A0A0K8TTH4_CONLV